MISLTPIILTSTLIMGVLCLVSLRRKDMTWIDFGWFCAMGAGGLILGISSAGDPWRRAVITFLILVWAGRLMLLMVRHRLGRGEDSRYSDLRQAAKVSDRVYAPCMYAAEALLVPLCLIPVAAVMALPDAFWRVQDFAGIAVLLAALAGEGIADSQLTRFRNETANRGRTCRLGLWRYSRHPNYFFEWLHWWAYVVFAIGTPALPLTFIGPVLMYIFIRYLTGIPHIERRALRSRGEEYRDYQRTTNMLIPWFPRKGGA